MPDALWFWGCPVVLSFVYPTNVDAESRVDASRGWLFLNLFVGLTFFPLSALRASPSAHGTSRLNPSAGASRPSPPPGASRSFPLLGTSRLSPDSKRFAPPSPLPSAARQLPVPNASYLSRRSPALRTNPRSAPRCFVSHPRPLALHAPHAK